MTNNLFYTYRECERLVKTEQHAHTNFTHGQNSPEEMIMAAIKLGLKRLVFTEHTQRGSDWCRDFAELVSSLKQKYLGQIEVILGLEAKLINFQGDIDATTEQKNLAEIIIGSVHGYCRGKEGDYIPFEEISPAGALEMELEQTEILIKNHKKSGLNVIGHPFGVFIKNYRREVPLEYWEKCIREISEFGLAFDLNYLYHQKYFPEIIKLLIKYNTLINLGSDAHQTSEVGLGAAYLQKILDHKIK